MTHPKLEIKIQNVQSILILKLNLKILKIINNFFLLNIIYVLISLSMLKNLLNLYNTLILKQ